MKRFCVVLLAVLICLSAKAQKDTSAVKSEKQKLSPEVFKDSLDGAFDMSDFLIGFHGFIPVVQLITEPALGGIGATLAPVFIQPNKHQIKGTYTPPGYYDRLCGLHGQSHLGTRRNSHCFFAKATLKISGGSGLWRCKYGLLSPVTTHWRSGF